MLIKENAKLKEANKLNEATRNLLARLKEENEKLRECVMRIAAFHVKEDDFWNVKLENAIEMILEDMELARQCLKELDRIE